MGEVHGKIFLDIRGKLYDVKFRREKEYFSREYLEILADQCKIFRKNFNKHFGGKIVIGEHLRGNIIEEGRNERRNIHREKMNYIMG